MRRVVDAVEELEVMEALVREVIEHDGGAWPSGLID